MLEGVSLSMGNNFFSIKCAIGVGFYQMYALKFDMILVWFGVTVLPFFLGSVILVGMHRHVQMRRSS